MKSFDYGICNIQSKNELQVISEILKPTVCPCCGEIWNGTGKSPFFIKTVYIDDCQSFRYFLKYGKAKMRVKLYRCSKCSKQFSTYTLEKNTNWKLFTFDTIMFLLSVIFLIYVIVSKLYNLDYLTTIQGTIVGIGCILLTYAFIINPIIILCVGADIQKLPKNIEDSLWIYDDRYLNSCFDKQFTSKTNIQVYN